jgi:hypothetical protein
MSDYTDLDVSAETVAIWTQKLAGIAKNLSNKNKEEEAKMMYICSLLMGELVTKIECEQLTSPFPTLPGVA